MKTEAQSDPPVRQPAKQTGDEPQFFTEHQRYRLSKAFNEWMRRYTENPAEFQREFETVLEYRDAQSEEREPAYGMSCALYLERMIAAVEGRS